MNKIMKKITAGVSAASFVAVSVVSSVSTVSAQTSKITDGVNKATPTGQSGTLFGSDSIFINVINTLLFVIGALSVVMLIYGGIRYTTSGGNATSVTAAKNTIMYAIIGLVVAFLAFAIVNWVLSGLGGNPGQ